MVQGAIVLSNWRKYLIKIKEIQLPESPIPAPPAPAPSQKASSDDISGTKRGTVDPLVSKRPEKNSESENLKNEPIKKNDTFSK